MLLTNLFTVNKVISFLTSFTRGSKFNLWTCDILAVYKEIISYISCLLLIVFVAVRFDTLLSGNSLPLPAEHTGFSCFCQTTAVGDCQVSYSIICDKEGDQQFTKVTKVINYEKCQNRPEFKQYTFNAERCENCRQVMCWTSPFFFGNF